MLPTGAEVVAMTAGLLASARPGDMSAAQIRDLAASTVAQAQQISYLLGKLAGYLDDDQPPAGGDRNAG